MTFTHHLSEPFDDYCKLAKCSLFDTLFETAPTTTPD